MHSGRASVKANTAEAGSSKKCSGDSFGHSDSHIMVSHPDRSASAEQEQEQNWAKEDQRGTGTDRITGVFWNTLQHELPDLDM